MTGPCHDTAGAGSIKVNIGIIVIYRITNTYLTAMSSTSISNTGFARAIAITGFLAGTLDLLAAFVSAGLRSGTSPEAVLRFIASGVFGAEAFRGSILFAVMGLFFHYVITMGWTVLFFVGYQKLAFLRGNPWLTGPLYGAAVWAGMNLLVLPLSNTPKFPFSLSSAAIGVSILILAVGLPIALMAKRFFTKASQS